MSSYGTKVKSEAQKNLRRVEEVEKKKKTTGLSGRTARKSDILLA